MRTILVLIGIAATAACAASPTTTAPDSPADPVAFDLGGHCFRLRTTGTVSPDVRLPSLIELTREPAPNFVEPGRFAVREPGAGEPRAPISSWRPTGETSLELVLGGGYTGYTFALTRAGQEWVGKGEYWADMRLEPAPGPLALRLLRQSCR